MSSSHLCIPRNETVQPPYFQNRIIMLCLPVPTLIYLWETYILYFQDRSVCFAAAKYECGNWDSGRAIPRKGIHKWDFRCSVGREVTYCSLLLWALAFLYKPVNLVKALCTVLELKFVHLGMDSCDVGWITVTWDWILWLGMDSYDLEWIPVTWYGFLWVGMGPWHPDICPWPSYKPYDDFLCEMVCALKGTIAWDDFFAHCILSSWRKDLTNFPCCANIY